VLLRLERAGMRGAASVRRSGSTGRAL